MWYARADTTLETGHPQTGYAWSTDGINWTRYSLPGGIIKEGNIYYMWYYGISKTGTIGPGRNQIGFARSSDGKQWKRYPHPVLIPGMGGQWDADIFFPGNVIRNNGLYKMWFTGGSGLFFNANHRLSIGYATSPDGYCY